MRKLVIVSGFAAASLIAGSAMAQDAPPPGQRGERMWEELDANGDGLITLSEMDARHREMFSAADANGDGAISKDEMKAHMRETHAGMRAKMMGDENGDGVVTRAEFDKHSSERFGELDRNGDGEISAEEFDAARKKHGPGKRRAR